MAKRVFERAEQEHEKKVKQIEQERAALDERAKGESARWEKQKRKLESTLRRARD